MSIGSGTYKITNIQSGQALHLFDDNKSVVASSIVDSDRQLVRIARFLTSICHCTHNAPVDSSTRN
jgi:hypothetical protein